jgi:uncharacterized protein
MKRANVMKAQGKLSISTSGPPPYAFCAEGVAKISNPNISERFAAVEADDTEKIKTFASRDQNVNPREMFNERSALFRKLGKLHCGGDQYSLLDWSNFRRREFSIRRLSLGVAFALYLGLVLCGCLTTERADGKYEVRFVWDGETRKAQVFRDQANREVRTAIRNEVLRNAEPAIAERLRKANLRYAQGKLEIELSGPPPYAIFTGAIQISSPSISDLFAAVESDNVDKIKVLTAQYHNVNQRDLPSERTALFMAAAGGHVNSLRMLIHLGADPTTPDFEGDSPLHAAVIADSQPSVESLIAAGANINSANGAGLTPLMVAANLGRIRILQLLLRSGADPSLRSNNGKTALHFARDAGQNQAMTILEQPRESR